MGVTIEEVCEIKEIKKNSSENCFLLSGFDRRGGGNMNGNRNGFNNNYQGTYNNSQPSSFSGKRSRSRSPIPSTYNGTHNDGNDYKRARTDTSGPPNVTLFHFTKTYSIKFYFFRKQLDILKHQ